MNNLKKYVSLSYWSEYLALLMILIFSILYLRVVFINYHFFETGIDLAGYSQALFNLSHFHMPFSSFKNQIMWGDHAHFFIVLLAPFYRIFPDPRFLTIFQTLTVTTAGWAVYKLSKDIVKNKVFSLAILYSYLAFIGIQYALNSDFHPSVITAVTLLWFFYGYHFKKWWLFWIMLAIGLMTREDAPPIFFMIGIYLLLRKKWKLGLSVMAFSAIYFGLVAYLIMPIWTKDHAVLSYLDNDQKDPYNVLRGFFQYPKAMLQNMIDTNEKVKTIKTLFSSFGFLSLFSPLTYLTGAPIFYSRFASPNEYRWLIKNYSNANITPLLIMGAIYGAANISRFLKFVKLNKLAILLPYLLAALLVFSVQINTWTDDTAPLYTSKEKHLLPGELANQRENVFKKASAIIPKDAGVTASSGFTARLANRKMIINYPEIKDSTQWVIISPFANPWPFSRDEMKREVNFMQKDERFEQVLYDKGIYVFKRVAKNS